MADTARSYADIIALFANNTSGDISAQDLRDFVATMKSSHGGFYISTAAETSISTVDTWTKVSGTTTSVDLDSFTMPASNRLTYTGTPDVRLHGQFTGSFQGAANAKAWEIGLAKNGTIITDSIVGQQIVTSAQEENVVVTVDVAVSTNDYVEVFIQNTTDNTNATMSYGRMFMHTHFV